MFFFQLKKVPVVLPEKYASLSKNVQEIIRQEAMKEAQAKDPLGFSVSPPFLHGDHDCLL